MPTDPTPDSPLNPEEADALRALRQPSVPSAHLYSAVASGLRERGAFRSRVRPWLNAVGIAAAVTLAFLAGRKSAAPSAPSSDPEFAMFLLNTPPVAPRPGVTNAQIVEEYRSWASALAREGRLAVGEELAGQRYLVDSAGSRPGSLAEGVDGLFVVRARDLDAAIALARTLPHARQGGVVAVQPVAVR